MGLIQLFQSWRPFVSTTQGRCFAPTLGWMVESRWDSPRLHCECAPVKSLVIGGVEDHVHLLFAFSRTDAVADIVQAVKRGSSIWLKTQSPALADFAWQNGYGVFSIGFSQIDVVRAYIAGQEEHHRRTSFHDELRELLRRYGIEYDERYVWD